MGHTENKNKTTYTNLFGNYVFKFFDHNGFAVYQGTVNGRPRYIKKTQKDNWMVKIPLIIYMSSIKKVDVKRFKIFPSFVISLNKDSYLFFKNIDQ